MSARGDDPGGNRRGRPGAAARGDLLALGAGAILPLAFAPFDWFPVTFLSLAGLFLLWRGVGPRRALWRGWLFGVGMFGVGASWVFVSIHRYGNASVVLAALLTALFVVLLAGFPAAAGGLARRFGTGTAGLALGFPAWWMLIEWLREWFLTGFPWLSVGYSQLDAPLGALAPVAGVYGVGAAAALTAGCAAAALTAPGRRRALPIIVIVALWGVSWGLGWVAWTRPVGAPLRVSLVQGNVSQDLKWRPDQLDSILGRYADLTARHWDSRLIVWPETAVPAFYHQIRAAFLAPLAAQARRHDTTLLTGVPVLEPATGRYYNAVVRLGAGGPPAFYFKHHLVPFGEYVPLHAYLDNLLRFLDIPWSDFSAGAAYQPPLKVAGRPIQTSICYEDAFPTEIIRYLPRAQLLVNVSDDAWFGDSLAPHQQLQMARMRARETGRYLLSDTNDGITAIVGPRGAILERAPQFRTWVLDGTVRFMEGATPYVRWGNLPVVILCALGALGALAAAIPLARRR